VVAHVDADPMSLDPALHMDNALTLYSRPRRLLSRSYASDGLRFTELFPISPHLVIRLITTWPMREIQSAKLLLMSCAGGRWSGLSKRLHPCPALESVFCGFA
jgi:hypothetical protein